MSRDSPKDDPRDLHYGGLKLAPPEAHLPAVGVDDVVGRGLDRLHPPATGAHARAGDQRPGARPDITPEEARHGDLLARLGGEKLAILPENSDRAQASAVAIALRADAAMSVADTSCE